MRIVTLNCWGGRIPELLDFLPTLCADVYCLQEIYSAPEGTPSPLTFPENREAAVLPRLFSSIGKSLPNHRGSFYPFVQGYLNDTRRTEHKIWYGIATFIRNTLSVIGERMEFVHGTYRHSGWGESPLSRNAHCIRIWRPETESPLVITHMHGLWTRNGKGDSPERLEQANKLAKLCFEMKEGADLVVCGDFNILPGSATLQMLGALGLKDLVIEGGHTDTRTSHYKKSLRYADYMMVSRDMPVTSFQVLTDPEISDHRPLILDC